MDFDDDSGEFIDLNEKVGGIMMIDGINALARDPATEVIVLVSKPPAPSVQATLIRLLPDGERDETFPASPPVAASIALRYCVTAE